VRGKVGERTTEALAWRAPELRVEPTYYRASPETAVATGIAREPEPEDEVDRLFTGGH